MKKLILIVVVFISIFAISCTEESLIPSQDTLNGNGRETGTAGGSATEDDAIAGLGNG